MTVTYSLDVSSSSFFCLYKLLFRWKGSIWKSVWSELLVWLFFYGILSVIYRLALVQHQRELFEDISIFCDTYSGFIPITFMLGFYVSTLFTRWGQIFDNIGWIDAPGLMIAAYVEGRTELARNIRRNTLRYMVLTQALVFRDVSVSVRKRFPTLNHLVTAGFMTQAELIHFEGVESGYSKYWQPMQWLFAELRFARQTGLIASDIIYTDLIEKIRVFRSNVLNLTLFDWVPVPLLYTQVVHLAVRSFFVVALMGRQFLSPTRDLSNVGFKQTIDIYIPIMSMLQFTFFVGWMKVAEVMLNPLGDDDDDFETNYILDRNLQVGMSMVDDQFDKAPPIERDAFWEDVMAEPLYTPEAASRPCNPQIGSCANIHTAYDDNVMLRFRGRRNSKFSTSMAPDECDVVPVTGLNPRPQMNSRDSEEWFSQSVMSQGRKLSNFFGRMRGGRRSTLSSDRRVYPRQDDQPPSRRESQDSMDRFGESFHNLPMPASVAKTNGSVSPKPSLAGEEPVQWTVDEMLPVIEEEEPKRNSTDTESSLRKKNGGSPQQPTDKQ